MSSFPLFAPDGSVRQVPAEQLTDALNAGGKRAVQMTDPMGVLRYVPEDQVNTAMQSGGKVYQPAPSFWQDPKTFLQNQSQEMGQAAQNQMNQALGPESQGKSLLSRMGHATLSYLPAAASTVEGMASGLVGTDAGTWKNAAMVAAGAIDPATSRRLLRHARHGPTHRPNSGRQSGRSFTGERAKRFASGRECRGRRQRGQYASVRNCTKSGTANCARHGKSNQCSFE